MCETKPIIMWRYLLVLLMALPPAAVLLNHDIISLVFILGWTYVVIPLCIVQAVDLCRDPRQRRSTWVRNSIKAAVGLFGLFSLLAGAFIIVWCLFNVGVQRLPEYSGPADAVEVWLSRFGIAPVLIAFGWYLIRLSLHAANEPEEKV